MVLGAWRCWRGVLVPFPLSLIKLLHLFVCVSMSTPQSVCGSQKTTCRSQFILPSFGSADQTQAVWLSVRVQEMHPASSCFPF